MYNNAYYNNKKIKFMYTITKIIALKLRIVKNILEHNLRSINVGKID